MKLQQFLLFMIIVTITRQSLSIKLPNGKFLEFPYDPNQTILNAKIQFAALLKIPVSSLAQAQIKGLSLIDSQTLAQAGIVDGQVFACGPTPISIIIKTCSGKKITLSILASATIATLKALIQTSTNIPTSQQILIFKGQILADANTLSSYNIVQGSIIRLVPNVNGCPIYNNNNNRH